MRTTIIAAASAATHLNAMSGTREPGAGNTGEMEGTEFMEKNRREPPHARLLRARFNI
jgi:hypothetical protein